MLMAHAIAKPTQVQRSATNVFAQDRCRKQPTITLRGIEHKLKSHQQSHKGHAKTTGAIFVTGQRAGSYGSYDQLYTLDVQIFEDVEHRRVLPRIVWEAELPVCVHSVKSFLLLSSSTLRSQIYH